MLSRAAYRARQVLHALNPTFEDGHARRVRELLSDGEMRLFAAMPARDQRHGIRVMEHLEREDVGDRDLLAAALLHDCGKGDVPVWLRAAYVAWPGLVARLAADCETGAADVMTASGTAAAAYRLVHHVRLGAELAQSAGASEACVRYISGKVAEHEHAKIALLRAADDRS